MRETGRRVGGSQEWIRSSPKGAWRSQKSKRCYSYPERNIDRTTSKSAAGFGRHEAIPQMIECLGFKSTAMFCWIFDSFLYVSIVINRNKCINQTTFSWSNYVNPGSHCVSGRCADILRHREKECYSTENSINANRIGISKDKGWTNLWFLVKMESKTMVYGKTEVSFCQSTGQQKKNTNDQIFLSLIDWKEGDRIFFIELHRCHYRRRRGGVEWISGDSTRKKDIDERHFEFRVR